VVFAGTSCLIERRLSSCAACAAEKPPLRAKHQPGDVHFAGVIQRRR
jgi:hypothetical protein